MRDDGVLNNIFLKISRFEGVLVFLLPVFAYSVSYTFELGVAGFFGYPKGFISIGFEIAIKNIPIVVCYLFILWFFCLLLIDFFGRFEASDRFKNNFFAPFLLLVFLVFIGGFDPGVIAVAVLLLAMLFMFFLISLAASKGSLENLRFRGVDKNERLRRARGYGEIGRLGKGIVVTLLVYALAFAAGKFYAGNLINFYTLEKNGFEYVVIRQYGDIIVSTEYDLEGLEKPRSFFVFEKKDAKGPFLLLGKGESESLRRSFSLQKFVF